MIKRIPFSYKIKLQIGFLKRNFLTMVKQNVSPNSIHTAHLLLRLMPPSPFHHAAIASASPCITLPSPCRQPASPPQGGDAHPVGWEWMFGTIYSPRRPPKDSSLSSATDSHLTTTQISPMPLTRNNHQSLYINHRSPILSDDM